MKKLFLAVALAVLSTTACAKEEKKLPAVEVTAKKLSADDAKVDNQKEAPKTKRVCVTTTDKNGKSVEKCRNVKIHKKLEGTSIEDVKKESKKK